MGWFSRGPRGPRLWVLLDVDGTLSPFGRVRRGEDYLMASAPEGNVTIPGWVPDALQRLQEEGIGLAWYTAWTTTANDVIAPLLGLPALPVAPLASGMDEPAMLKASGLTGWREYSPHDRYLILDDDLPEHVRAVLPTNARGHQIDPSIGLQPSDLIAASTLLRTWPV